MDLIIEGIIKEIFDQEKISATYTKQDILVTYDTNYPKDILLTSSGKALDYVKDFQVGDTIEAHFSIKARQAKDNKFFGNSLNVWKISRIGSNRNHYHQKEKEPVMTSSTYDDLPF